MPIKILIHRIKEGNAQYEISNAARALTEETNNFIKEHPGQKPEVRVYQTSAGSGSNHAEKIEHLVTVVVECPDQPTQKPS